MIKRLPKYKKLQNKSRYTIVRGGRGSAKSFHVSLFLANLSFQKGEVILFTRYTMTSAKKSIIPEFQEKIDLWGVSSYFEIRQNEIYNKQSGSRIIFSGIKTSSGNQTASLKSITGLTVWVLDEAEEMVNEREFDKIDDSIRKKDGSNKVFLVFNTDRVDTQHWIYKRFFQGGENYPNTTYIHTSYLDNLKNLADSFIQKAEYIKENDPEFYSVNYLGEFAKLVDVVFQGGYQSYDDEPESFDWQAVGGDFGFSDNPSTAILVTKHKNNLYLREILHGFGLSNDDIADSLKGYEGLTNVWDSAEPKSIAHLRKRNINAYPAQKKAGSVIFGIKTIQQYNVFIHRSSKNLQSEWVNYRWKKMANGEYARDSKGNRIPEKRNDHCIDAVRYPIITLYSWA